MKKYIKEIVALTIGLICGFVSYVKNSGPDKNLEPITISLNCSAVTSGIQFYYTTDSTQEFSNDQLVSSGALTDEKHLEFQLDVKSLNKLKMSLGNAPGVVTLKNITISGNKTVKITNFDNTVKNDIEEFFWNADTVYVRSAKANPYIVFETPFNINAKPNPSNSPIYVKSLIVFAIAALLCYLLLFIGKRILVKRHPEYKEASLSTILSSIWSNIKSCISSIMTFLKNNMKEVAAITIGIICTIAMYVQSSESEKESDPIVISLDCSTVVGGIQLYYTTEPGQEFSSSQVISSGEVRGDNHLDFLLGAKSLHKLRMDLGSCPGVFYLKDITISGDKTVRINNFDNTVLNQIDEVFWNGNKVFIKSLEQDPYVVFQTPFNINSKVNHTRLAIKSLIAFFAISLIAYLAICVLMRILTRNGSDIKRTYVTSMIIVAGLLSTIIARILAEKVGSYYQKEISISAKVKTQNPFNLTFFYTTSDNGQFSPQQMMDVPLKAGENEINVQMPIKSISKLRVDFGSNPGEVEVENIVIHGKEDVEIKSKDLKASIKNDLDEINILGEKLHIKSTKEDPWVAFDKDLKVGGSTIVNINVVIFLTLLLTLLAFFAFVIKITSKHVEGKKVEDLALVIVFISLCIVPTFFLTDQKVSESENRNLAEFPGMSDSTGFNSAFSTQFDTWYSDHFAKRDEIVSIHNSIFQSKGNAQNSNVIEGENGWYFYKLDKNIENFANLQVISDADLPLIKDYLLTINNWCNAHGKKFYFLVCPNKATIYGENVKHIKKLQPGENSDAMRLMNYLKGSEIKAVFSKDEIMKHKNDGYLLYRKQDTHHSELGAYYSYKAIMDVISKDFPIAATPLSKIPMIDYKDVADCDLKKMMPGAIKDDTCTYQHLDLNNANMTGGGSLVQFAMTNSDATGRLYLLGDSYSIALQMLFASNFNVINANRVNQYWFPDAELDKIEANSDIVILEVVERHLSLLSHQTISTKMQPFAPQQMAAVSK